MHKAILKSWFAVSVLIVSFVLFSSSTVEAFKIEFDDVNSTASGSMAVSVNAGGDSDSNSWQSTKVRNTNSVDAGACDFGAWATASSSVDTIAKDVSFETNEKYIGYPNIFEFCFHQSCESRPDWIRDEEGNIIAVIPAAFSSTLNATGTLYWKLLPSGQQEKIGMPVIVNFDFPYSIGSGSCNVTYEMGVYIWEVSIGRCTFGPYEALTYCSPCGNHNTFPPDTPGRWPLSANAVLGDTIKLSYHIRIDGYTEDSENTSIFVDSSYGDSIRMKFKIDVPKKEFMITFDDGPVPGKMGLPGNTENIVNALKNIYVGCEPVRAGFFMVGVGCYEDSKCFCPLWEKLKTKGSVRSNPVIVQTVAQAGHFIGNHTQHHPCFWWKWPWEYEDVKSEISACNNELKKALDPNEPNNVNLPKIFRPPYFVDNGAVRTAARKLGFQIIMGAGDDRDEAVDIKATLEWIDSGDMERAVSKIKETACDLIQSWQRDEPCVLVFHDISPVTANNIAEIIRYLREDKGFTLVHFDRNRLPGSIPSRVQQATNTIHQSETVTHTVSLDSTVSTATFNVSWEGSDLDLVLYKPDGTKIDSNSALLDPNVKYAERDTYEYYTVSDPNPGDWVMEVLGVNVPSEGEKYTIRVEADSNLALSVFTDKPDYGLNEHINISAQLVNDQNSVTGALVMASVQRPDGSVNNLTLYDDGTHGDKDPNDGFYTNAYNNTSLRGSYEITVSAIGEITGEQYERASSLTAMVGSIIYGNVDFEAYAVFADHWLAQNCTEPAWCDTADIDQSGQVDIFDLGALAEHWLAEYDLCPSDPNKVEPGTCGCGIPDMDINGDSIPDCGFRYGDVNGDGEISAYDAALAAQCSEGLIELQDIQRFAADVDGNGCVSDADADLIAQYAVGLITVFPVELMNPKPTAVPTCGCN